MAEKNNATSLVLGGALLLIGLFVIIALVLVRSQAATTTVDISNALPTNSLTKICAGDSVDEGCTAITTLTITPGGVKTFDIWSKVEDTNGIDDVDIGGGVVAVLYRTAVGAGCSADKNDCYTGLTCAKEAEPFATQGWYRCNDVEISYWADSTDASSDDYTNTTWTAKVTPSDAAGPASAPDTVTYALTDLASINFDLATIDYGSLALNAVSSPVLATATNYGNTDVDAVINADTTPMTCTIDGSIPLANQKFDTDTGATYGEMAKTLATSTNDIDFTAGNSAVSELCRRTSETNAVTDGANFMIQIPASGVGGTCSVAATIVAEKQTSACTGNGA
ncbi:MAG: hypothetical protein Q8P30_03310 [Candidatus Uhrbacteria bacterium]|nr:hypothetical protein [Candidatus Uhrbacteria bacterium]